MAEASGAPGGREGRLDGQPAIDRAHRKPPEPLEQDRQERGELPKPSRKHESNGSARSPR